MNPPSRTNALLVHSPNRRSSAFIGGPYRLRIVRTCRHSIWAADKRRSQNHPLLSEWNVLVGQRFERAFRDKMLAGAQDASGEASQQKSERALFSFSVGESDRHHGFWPLK